MTGYTRQVVAEARHQVRHWDGAGFGLRRFPEIKLPGLAPTLQRGSPSHRDAPASWAAGAARTAFPRWSVGNEMYR